ncbi:DUF551 domain-containing protein [Escherichia coli]|uniref:DUF551 domain-containing protein n=1 Tax=Escherichia coli TaxID=562 RepID=UPI000BE1DC04|nr:DUF551 domain-containing protein [Escherichia coli]
MTTITKEQLISHARESVSYLEDLKGRASKEGEDCKVVLEMVERELELARIALASLEAEPVAVNDDMAYAFHHALSDSSLGADEVEEIKTGLRAAFANVSFPVTADGWISCSERMPEKGQNVLISVNFDSSLVEPLICSARYTGSTFRRGEATIKPGNGIEQATHWMPLPEPPQEVK